MIIGGERNGLRPLSAPVQKLLNLNQADVQASGLQTASKASQTAN
jgi:hypothetical protein